MNANFSQQRSRFKQLVPDEGGRQSPRSKRSFRSWNSSAVGKTSGRHPASKGHAEKGPPEMQKKRERHRPATGILQNGRQIQKKTRAPSSSDGHPGKWPPKSKKKRERHRPATGILENGRRIQQKKRESHRPATGILENGRRNPKKCQRNAASKGRGKNLSFQVIAIARPFNVGSGCPLLV